jgi:hypothetical protein
MISTTGTYIQPSITATLRASAFNYVATDVPAGRTIAEQRRGRACDEQRKTVFGLGIRRRGTRYPDDPVGNPETTDGGW